MSDYHCLEVEFPAVDFSKYGYLNQQSVYHAHLYARENEIELRILFDEKLGFGGALTGWLSKVNRRNFGSFIKVYVTKNHTNKRVQRVDLSQAKLVGYADSTRFYEGGRKYIALRIDTVKIYWNSVDGENNKAEFYLDDHGFRVVEPFYSLLTPRSWLNIDGNFNIGRMRDSAKFYKLLKSTFRPEFNFVSNDNREARVATVTKEPKIQFKYRVGVTEDEALFYGDVVLMLASFYYHIKIDYILRRIHFPETTITIKNIINKRFLDNIGGLFGFGIYWDFNEFLQSSWQKQTVKNFALLSKSVSLFNQSHLVDSYSAFLIRYNIIEICDKQKNGNDKFKFVLNKKQTKVKQDEAFSKLLETVDKAEYDEFKKRWHSVQTLLQNKPMKNQLTSFLESQGLVPQEFPVKLKDLNELRNNITHGSIESVNAEQLRRANILLYRISGILILNLMGIKDWKLNTEIN